MSLSEMSQHGAVPLYHPRSLGQVPRNMGTLATHRKGLGVWDEQCARLIHVLATRRVCVYATHPTRGPEKAAADSVQCVRLNGAVYERSLDVGVACSPRGNVTSGERGIVCQCVWVICQNAASACSYIPHRTGVREARCALVILLWSCRVGAQ